MVTRRSIQGTPYWTWVQSTTVLSVSYSRLPQADPACTFDYQLPFSSWNARISTCPRKQGLSLRGDHTDGKWNYSSASRASIYDSGERRFIIRVRGTTSTTSRYIDVFPVSHRSQVNGLSHVYWSQPACHPRHTFPWFSSDLSTSMSQGCLLECNTAFSG